MIYRKKTKKRESQRFVKDKVERKEKQISNIEARSLKLILSTICKESRSQKIK